MSDMERNKGVLYPSQHTLEELAEIKVPDDAVEGSVFHQSKVEYFLENKPEDICIINGKPYLVVWEIRRDTDGLSGWANLHKDGKGIHFDTYHYNGGAHWSDVLQDNWKEEFDA